MTQKSFIMERGDSKKHSVMYHELDADSKRLNPYAPGGTLKTSYIQKDSLDQLGHPQKIKVTIEAVE